VIAITETKAKRVLFIGSTAGGGVNEPRGWWLDITCSFWVGRGDSSREPHREYLVNTCKSSLPSEGQKAVWMDGCIDLF
jgi:hypothetical protein